MTDAPHPLHKRHPRSFRKNKFVYPVPSETALITGASSGIGLELAKVFAEGGSHVVLVARRKSTLERLATELRGQFPIDVRVIGKDLTEPHAPQSLFDQLQSEKCTVDVLVNSAGFGTVGPLAELDLDRQLDCVQVNVTALTHLVRLFLPGMIERARGGLLNVASTAAFQAGPNMAVYFATKAYVLSLTEAIAEETRGTGVRVSCLCPGPTATGFAKNARMAHTRLFRMGTMGATSVARAGYRGFRRNKTIVIPGVFNKILSRSASVVPRSLARQIAKLLTS